MKKPYTAKQGQYLAFIFYYTKIHGVAPAEADMENYFKVSPPSGAPQTRAGGLSGRPANSGGEFSSFVVLETS